MPMNKPSMGLSILCLLFCFFPASLGGNSKLATSFKNLEESVRESNGVYVVRFLSLGMRDLGSIGMWDYLGAEIEVREVLSGAVKTHLKCSFSIVSDPEKREEPPEIGAEYIVIGYPAGDGNLEITRMLSALAENLTLVKSLLSRRSVVPEPHPMKIPADSTPIQAPFVEAASTRSTPSSVASSAPCGRPAGARSAGDASASRRLFPPSASRRLPS